MQRSPAKTLKQTLSLVGLVLLGLFITTQTCQAQTASVETAEAKEQISKSIGSFKLTVPSLNNAGSGGNPAPAGGGAPQPGVSSLSGRVTSRDRNAPRRYDLKAIKVIKHVNGLVGGFDTGAGFGFGLELTTADLIPLVEVYARGIGTSLLYHQGEAGVIVGNEKTKGNVFFNYTRREEDKFFGIGPQSSRDVRTSYATEARSAGGILSHKFFKSLEGGVYGKFSNTGAIKGEDDNDPPINCFFVGNVPAPPNTTCVGVGTAPPLLTGLNAFLPGFNQNVELASYGGYGELDLRNNDKGLTQGYYFYGRFGSVDGLDNDQTATSLNSSDFGWLETELDGRVYIPVFSRKTSVALRAYADLRKPKGGSQIPFYELAALGGRSLGRGFEALRFRGNNLALFSAEIRQTVWTMDEDRGVDVIGFVDGGQVWGDNRYKLNPLLVAPQNCQINPQTSTARVVQNDRFCDQNYRIGAGGGLSYRFNKSTAFRVDVGASNERTLIYLGVSRGF